MRIALLPLLCLAACGGASDLADGGNDIPPSSCTPAEAFQTVQSTSGLYSLSACTSGTPARGENAFTYLITDAKSGTPVDGLTLAVQTWMPDMGHGGPTTPTITPLDGGFYQITNCVLTMGGVWQLRTTLQGAISDDAIVQFQID